LEKETLQQKIGILGGTFDPVHKGHLAVARSVLDRLSLDEILFVPAFSPPHKDAKLTPFVHRLAMLEACLANIENMSVSTLEAERNEPSYTVQTLHELHKRMPNCTFFLIVGADMFAEIELWYHYQDLFQLSHIIVAARPGISHDRVVDQVTCLPGSFQQDQKEYHWQRDDGCTISYLADIAETISSSQIRESLYLGEQTRAYLEEPVLEYIQQHALYTKDV
jgi:nicotinate-nucleotide adenylyltransferase